MNHLFYLVVLLFCSMISYVLPERCHKYILLLASFLFFIFLSPSALLYVGVITMISYIVARFIEKCKSRILLGGFTFLLIAALAVIKYSELWCEESIVIPLGMSYYSLMVTGYLTEIYRGSEKAEKNIVNYMLFVCFFPQIVAGPIGRSRELFSQYRERISFDLCQIRTGFIMVMLGLFEKIVLADNMRILVTGICEGEYRGAAVVLALLLYSFVIYFDFGGYSLIAVGGAKMLGVRLMTNFDAPYFSCSIQEFWRRWHISLSSWFRDYVYIPLGGSRKGALRRDFNTFLVFVLSGAWHGASIGYLVWGAIHGVYLVVSKRTKNLRNKWFGKMRQKERFVWLQRTIVFLLVSLAWVPFYAGSFAKMGSLLGRMSGGGIWTLTDGSLLKLGVDGPTMVVCILGAFLVFAIDSSHQSRNFYESMAKDNLLIRYGFYILMFLGIFLVGVYGTAYDASDFIYGQF